jgi:ABC-type Fe3+-hydroxamate transport system substrate-binding protein
MSTVPQTTPMPTTERPKPDRLLAQVLMLVTMALAAQASITVEDDLGRRITLAAPAQRIVSLTPHATEMLYAVGAGAQLVGRDVASDFPAAVQAVPVVGQYGAYNIEAILALKPDLIVGWQGPQSGAAMARLVALGLPLFSSQPGRIEQIPDTLRRLGLLSGHARTGEAVAARFSARWTALTARYAGQKTLRVVPQVGHQPAMTVNDAQFTAALFRACGTVNPLGQTSVPVPLISPEALLAARPHAVVALARPAVADAWLAPWRRHLPQTWFGQIDPDTAGRPGPRLIDAAERLCAQLDAVRRGPAAARIDALR